VLDLRYRRIPNWLTFTLMLSGLCLPWLNLSPAGGFGRAALGLALGFGLAVIPFLLGAWGAADVKLIAGVGAWLGPLALLEVFALAAIGGMIVALWVSSRQGKLRALLRDSAVMTVSAMHGSQKLGAFSPENRAGLGVDPSPFKRTPYALQLSIATVLIVLANVTLRAGS
jgi:prepilin peptidase CpaA